MGTCVTGRSNGNGVVEAELFIFSLKFTFNLILRRGSSSSFLNYAKFNRDPEFSRQYVLHYYVVLFFLSRKEETYLSLGRPNNKDGGPSINPL